MLGRAPILACLTDAGLYEMDTSGNLYRAVA